MRRQLALLMLGAALLPMAPGTARADGAGSVVAGVASMRGAGGFGATLLLTADEKQLRQSWNQPTLPVLKATNTVPRGAPVSALLIFTGCAANAQGVCDLVSEFMLESPDGTRVPAGGGAVWQDKPLPAGRSQLGTVSITMEFDATDPAGDYRVLAEVKDNVSGEKANLKVGLKVTQ